MQCTAVVTLISFLNVVGIQSNPEILHGFIKGSWKISGQALWYVIRYLDTCTRYQIILFPDSLTRYYTLKLNCVAVISFDENNNSQNFISRWSIRVRSILEMNRYGLAYDLMMFVVSFVTRWECYREIPEISE